MSAAKATALFVVGPPGAGKTSLVRALLPALDAVYLVPRPKWTVAEGQLVAAGHYTGQTFDGADQVPYNGVRPALDYWARALREAAPVTVFDGDRFSYEGVVAWLREREVCVRGVHLSLDEGTLEARRRARGSRQNDAWMRGRATKARRFAEALGAPALNAALPSEQLATQVRALLAAGP